MSPIGLGVYKGAAAIRRLFEGRRGSCVECEIETEGLLELGNEVTFPVDEGAVAAERRAEERG